MRIRRLDGIRAIAVIAVMLLHHAFPFGWEGVELFFVLSGFLITNILRKTRTSPTYWSRFYLKRAARILPPLVPMFLGTILFSKHLSVIGILGYGLFLGNFLDVSRYGIALLGPLWSLAVEEHFYLIWPSAVKRFTDQFLFSVTLAILFIEPIVREVATHYASSFRVIYELTPFRLDGLAAGAALAFLLDRDRSKQFFKSWGFLSFGVSLSIYIAASLLLTTFDRPHNSIIFNSFG